MLHQTLSDKGLRFLQDFEQWSPHPYRDQHGYWTVGWGHRIYGALNPYRMRALTRQEGDALLRQDIEAAERAVWLLQPSLTQTQYDALVILVFNIGVNAFANSTMRKLINKNEFELAAQQFDVWNHVDGKVSNGLTRRRARERKLFETGDYGFETP